MQSADTEQVDLKTEKTDDADEETKGRKYSYIWNFFKDHGGGRAECRVCKKVLSYRASVFNLMKHRQLRHPDQPSFRIVEEGGEKRVEGRQTPRPPKKERGHRPRSRVWQFFEYIDATYARCKMCRKELSHKYTSTNLLHHKDRMHPDIPLDYFTVSETPPAAESENDESSDDGGGADEPSFDPRDEDDDDDDPSFDPRGEDDEDDSSDSNRDDVNSRVQEEVEPPPPAIKVKRRKGEKWSSVWRLFERLDERSAKCKTCGRVYLHRSTNTNLRKHVRISHPAVFRKFERLCNNYRKSKLFDECFPPPVFPDPPPAKKPQPPVTVSSANTSRRPEIVITIANSDQQSHAYGGDTPYTLPIIFIQEDGNKAKAPPTAKMPPNNNNHHPGYALNNMGGNYAANSFATFENSGPVPTATGNNSCHDPTLIQNIAHNSALIQNIVGTMGQNSNIIENIAGNSGGHNPTPVQNMGGNIGHNPSVVQNIEYPAIAFDNNATLDVSSGQVASDVTGGQLVSGVNSGQVASGGGLGDSGGQSNDRLLFMVKESNQLLRGMHSAIQRQSDVLCRLAESIDAMRARNREERLTD